MRVIISWSFFAAVACSDHVGPASTTGDAGPNSADGDSVPGDSRLATGGDARAGDSRGPDLFVRPSDGVMAFPGAEGFGADTPGGRGGAIIEVTNLNDDGPGSLRAAVRSTGPRIVVFRVSGTINMASDIEISGDRRSYLTIAGQTSPGGIQLKGVNHGLTLSGGVRDVVVRHLRIRPGIDDMFTGNAGVMLINNVTNIVVDHVSAAWNSHKLMLTYHAQAKATFQWNILAEGPGAPFVLTQGSQDDQITFHHNLVAHGVFSITGFGARTFDVRNNLVYNYEGEVGSLGSPPADHVVANLVNNHFIPGQLGSRSHIFYLYDGKLGTRLFAQGNWGPLCPAGCANDWDNGFGDGDSPPAVSAQQKYAAPAELPVPPVSTQPTRDVREAVLAYAGASKPRDSFDERIAADVMNNRSKPSADKIGHGPWPVLDGPEPPPDRDHDGMADAWEVAHGLNPGDPADGRAVAKNRYTNVENYLNELAGDPVP